MSCYRPYFKGGMYLAWTDKTENYIGRGNISSNNIKYEVKLDYTKTGINYTLTIKSFDSDDVNTTYRCYMGFESFLANLVEMNTTFLCKFNNTYTLQSWDERCYSKKIFKLNRYSLTSFGGVRVA